MPKHSYESIQAEIARLQNLATKLKKQHAATKQRACRRVFALMKKLGLTIHDLTTIATRGAAPGRLAKSAAPKSVKTHRRGVRKVPIKYRGPHRGDTWTGRGKSPRWLAALIAAGNKKEDYLISK